VYAIELQHHKHLLYILHMIRTAGMNEIVF